ncbi:hypothetical protein [Neomoorella thermoacetica]|uniref:hypothetical protein n=1 Tax=Neomoorella thermoacetica TaxID=1525 RepID=UPI0030D224FB
MVKRAIRGRSFSLRLERLIQHIFARSCVDRSMALGLIPDPAALMIAWDGSPLRKGTSTAGVKVCRCRETGDIPLFLSPPLPGPRRHLGLG